MLLAVSHDSTHTHTHTHKHTPLPVHIKQLQELTGHCHNTIICYFGCLHSYIPLLSNAGLWMGWSYTSASPLCLHRHVMGWPLPFTLTFLLT